VFYKTRGDGPTCCIRGVEKQYGILFTFSLYMNTLTLHVYVFLSNIGFTRRNTLFVFLWLRRRNT